MLGAAKKKTTDNYWWYNRTRHAANALSSVTATPAAPPTTATPVVGTVDPAGAYSFTNLPAGSYTIAYTAASGYVNPAAQTATVTANSTLTLPAITIEQVVPDKTAALTPKPGS